MWPWHVRRWVSRWRSSAVEMRPRWWVVRAWRWIVRAWRRLVRRWPAVGVRLVAGRHGWVPHQGRSIGGASQAQPVWTYVGGETATERLSGAWFLCAFPPQTTFTFSFTHTAPTRYFLLVVRRAPPTSTQSQRNAQTPRTPHARTRPQHCQRRTVGAGAHQLLSHQSLRPHRFLFDPSRLGPCYGPCRHRRCRPPLPPRPHSMLRPPATGRGSSWAPPGLLKLLLRASRPERVPASCLRAGSAPWSPASARRS